MPFHVLPVIIVAAFLHATWNFFVKRSTDKYRSMSSVVLGHAPAALAVVLLTPVPDVDSYPYIAAGAVLHTGYQLFLLNSYRFGNLSSVYPIARGIAPLLVAGFSFLFLGVVFNFIEVGAIMVIALGLMVLACGANIDTEKWWYGVLFAVVTGAFIASYTLVDGLGARKSLNGVGFYGWLSTINAILFGAFMSITRPGLVSKTLSVDLLATLLLGSISFLAYALAIWCFTIAPIAFVAALRETSIVFAFILGVVFLKERVTAAKVFAVALIVGGVVIFRVIATL